jgi:hypothetical protein
MAKITTPGPAEKRETIYSGPPLQTSQGTVYNGPSTSIGRSVYDGPAPGPKTGGTVYGGPAPAAPNYGPAGTVYNPRQTATQFPVPQTDPAGVKGGNVFFAIAIFTALRTALIAAGVQALGSGYTIAQDQVAKLVVINVLIIGVFVMIGIFARHGSKAAFIVGMLLYGADTVLLVLSPNPETHIAGIVVHVIFLVGLFQSFRQLQC